MTGKETYFASWIRTNNLCARRIAIGYKSMSVRAKVGINTDKDIYMNRDLNDGDGKGSTK